MANVRIYLDGERFGKLFRQATEKKGAEMRQAVREAAKEAADEIKELGRANIAEAGHFGEKWIEGFDTKVSEGGGNIRIEVSEKQTLWPVWEYGMTIRGQPELFIPFSFADDAKGVWARDYPGQLFEVTRNSDGLKMLFTDDGSGEGARPVYFAKESVYEPRKFFFRDIIRAVAKTLPEKTRVHFKK